MIPHKNKSEASYDDDKDKEKITNYLSIDHQKQIVIENDDISYYLFCFVWTHGGNLKYYIKYELKDDGEKRQKRFFICLKITNSCDDDIHEVFELLNKKTMKWKFSGYPNFTKLKKQNGNTLKK